MGRLLGGVRVRVRTRGYVVFVCQHVCTSVVCMCTPVCMCDVNPCARVYVGGIGSKRVMLSGALRYRWSTSYVSTKG